MQFDYIETMISMSPLDFNYNYGEVNNNTPDKFRINNVSIITGPNFRSPYKLSNTSLNKNLFNNADEELSMFSAFEEDNTDYEVLGYTEATSILSDIYLTKETKQETEEIDYKSLVLEGAFTAFNSISGSFNVGSSNLNQGMALAANLMQTVALGVDIWATVHYGKQMVSKAREIADQKIEELNERISENKAFIEDLKEKMNKQKLKSISVT